MRYAYIDPFVTTTMRVLDAVIVGPVRQGDVAVLDGERIKGDVAVLVKVRGEAEGDIIFSTTTGTALEICRKLFGEATQAMTPQSTDALGELVNMIAGNAVSALNDLGFDFTISPPEIITRDTCLESGPGTEFLEIPLFWTCGEMTMNVLLGTD